MVHIALAHVLVTTTVEALVGCLGVFLDPTSNDNQPAPIFSEYRWGAYQILYAGICKLCLLVVPMILCLQDLIYILDRRFCFKGLHFECLSTNTSSVGDNLDLRPTF